MIAVLDYGSGNVKAFLNAFERLKIVSRPARDAGDLAGASHIILPGVGAFDTALRQFDKSGLRPLVEQLVLERSVPVLGVCVGMQILADSSEEGNARGLGWIPGRVRRLTSPVGHELRLPHMGWNRISVLGACDLLAGLPNGGQFYFLHSYFFDCADKSSAIAQSTYGGNFTCAVRRNNIYAVQFHPEKSHDDGMRLLKNFSEI